MTRVLDDSTEHAGEERPLLCDSTLAMAVVTLDGHFVRANAAFCELVGRTALNATKWNDIVRSDDVTTLLELSTAITSGTRVTFRASAERDGEKLALSVNCAMVRIGGEDALSMLLTDAGEHEEALKSTPRRQLQYNRVGRRVALAINYAARTS
ncbi:MAG: PAS domain-containing protein [Acidimicrobiales bacterium]